MATAATAARSDLAADHREPTSSRAWLTVAAMCLATAMTFLEITGTISGLSTMQSDLHVSAANVVWIPSSYTLVLASLVLSASTLGTRYGRKRVFCLGVVVLAMGSVAVAASSTLSQVIAGQAVVGLGAALILPNSVAIIGHTFTDPQKRTEAISIWAASSGIGLAAGPLTAGVLLNHFSWNAVFLVNPAFSLLALALAIPLVAEFRQPDAGRLDVAGLALGTLTIASLVYAFIAGGHEGYTSGPVLIAWASFAASAALFIVIETRRAAPMLDVSLFRSHSFSSVMVVAAVALFGFTGVALLQVLFFERVQNLAPLDTAWRVVTMMAAYVVGAALSGRLVRRTGFKLPLAVGLIVAGGASIALVSQQPDTGFGQVWALFAAYGFSIGFVIAPSTAAAMISVAPQHAGMASGAVNTARQVGAVLGTSILGTILTSQFASHLPGELAAHDVPVAARGPIAASIASGNHGSGPLPAGARDAIQAAFTGGVHIGLVVNGVLFALAALLVVVGVHNTPHHQ
jgi:EmrB/QacA subfamily drug resistance transporter